MIKKYKMLGVTKAASLLEYGLLVGLIAVASIGAVLSNGEQVRAVFSDVSTILAEKMPFELGAASSGGQPPAAPTPLPPPLWSMTITAAANPFSAAEIGFVAGNYGVLVDEEDTLLTARDLHTAAHSSGFMGIVLMQDQTGYIPGKTLSCDNGIGTFSFDDAFVNLFVPAQNYTISRWTKTDNFMVPGQTYTCVITE